MTRVLSGAVLGAAFFTIVWFGTTAVLLGVLDRGIGAIGRKPRHW